jgi:hypothetical protein
MIEDLKKLRNSTHAFLAYDKGLRKLKTTKPTKKKLKIFVSGGKKLAYIYDE